MKISEDKNTITFRITDDWHFHFRQGALLEFLVRLLIKHGWRGRVVGEPNITPPILTGDKAVVYHDRIMGSAERLCSTFKMIRVMQITEQTTRMMVRAAYFAGVRIFKVYPRWVTTNSENGVVDYTMIYPALDELQKLRQENYNPGEPDVVAQFHAESPREEIEGLFKEEAFLTDECEMGGINCKFPELPMTIEHIKSAFGVKWILQQPGTRKIAAGITIQHITNTVDDVLGYSRRSGGLVCVHDGFKPHAGLRADRAAVQEVVLSGNPLFFYAGDGAWHFRKKKECCGASCGAANTLAALPLLIKFFKGNNMLHRLEPFTSQFGAEFYGYPLNEGTVTFVRKPWKIPETLPVIGVVDDVVVPWRFGEEMEWQITD
ncbi:MAG: hypothetical protein NUV53_04870 [Patescibacteria group bacterium]|nr:hypothetical protein [Patescibacteria group bacterium]